MSQTINGKLHILKRLMAETSIFTLGFQSHRRFLQGLQLTNPISMTLASAAAWPQLRKILFGMKTPSIFWWFAKNRFTKIWSCLKFVYRCRALRSYNPWFRLLAPTSRLLMKTTISLDVSCNAHFCSILVIPKALWRQPRSVDKLRKYSLCLALFRRVQLRIQFVLESNHWIRSVESHCVPMFKNTLTCTFRSIYSLRSTFRRSASAFA